MADSVTNAFEIERRGIMWTPLITLNDGITSLGYDGDPNNVIDGNTPGESWLYSLPIGQFYKQSDATLWWKSEAPNTWINLSEGGGVGDVENDDIPYVRKNKAWVKLVDYMYPVGSTYEQYPSVASNIESTAFPTTETPASLYGGTWSEIWDTESVFFRTEGTDVAFTDNGSAATARVNGLAKDKVQRIIGDVNNWRYSSMSFFLSANNAFSVTANAVNASFGVPGGSGTKLDKFSFRNYNSVNSRVTTTTSGSTEPRNRLFKIWVREEDE